MVDNLVELLKTREILMNLDISWTKLTPLQLCKISEVLKNEDYNPCRVMRNLNLSYNSLHFDETSEEMLPSEKFLENMIAFVKTAAVLVHLDISGMNLGRDYNPETFNYISD